MKKQVRKSRHGRTARDQIKLSCKVDFSTWRRVNKAAELADKDTAAYLRGLIMEAVWSVPLTKEDYDIIEAQKAKRGE